MSDDDHQSVDELQANARRHLWMHFSQLGQFREREVPVIMRGEGCYVWDQHDDRKLDGLSGLFTVQIGHGRRRLAHDRGDTQAEEGDQRQIEHCPAGCP